MRDSKGRPLVAVTGVGVVPSLGQGQDDNWAGATAGRTGIHAITRFPTEGLRTRIAGTIDFLPRSLCAPCFERYAPGPLGGRQSGAGRPGDFPVRCFMPCPGREEWTHRERSPTPRARTAR